MLIMSDVGNTGRREKMLSMRKAQKTSKEEPCLFKYKNISEGISLRGDVLIELPEYEYK